MELEFLIWDFNISKFKAKSNWFKWDFKIINLTWWKVDLDDFFTTKIDFLWIRNLRTCSLIEFSLNLANLIFLITIKFSSLSQLIFQYIIVLSPFQFSPFLLLIAKHFHHPSGWHLKLLHYHNFGRNYISIVELGYKFCFDTINNKNPLIIGWFNWTS